MTIAPSPSLPTTRVGMIGAGASGLSQIQQLLEIWDQHKDVRGKTKLEIVGFESKSDVGGVWLTDDQPKPNIRTHLTSKENNEETYSYPPKGTNPSPMYQGLRTNLPHDLMSFRGYPFPEDTPLFPKQELVEQYLQSYTEHYNLRKHIRFSTRVERVYLTPQQDQNGSSDKKRWTIESNNLHSDERKSEQFDYVVVSNGHYSDGWIPPIKGLSTFPGQIIHSRFFHRASDYIGKTVLVVGSFASGGDISRLLASENINKFSPSGEPLNGFSKEEYLKVYVSTSGYTQYSATEGPWAEYIQHVPLISHLTPPDESQSHTKGTIHLEEDEQGEKRELDDVDVIIFATGYNFLFPFFKITDEPWDKTRLSEGNVKSEERQKGDGWEENGIKGQGVDGLDELLLFLKGDRTISFPTLSYQNVPFPLTQVQSRFTAYLWAGLLELPEQITLPPNPSNPYSSSQQEIKDDKAADSFNTSSSSSQDKGSVDPPQPTAEPKKPRKVLQRIRHLVFGAPYEWTYSEFLMDFMTQSDQKHGVETEDHWKKIEGWRRDRRADTSLRKRMLGY
ncbi:hypothetical protein I203_101082 [Kwoniella mangroviensis CBS 8507]|uniref:uncharacterized protein n=1 Tax=Kwoniella mangroviensis CBS 8507 TaxID=1296122 RepID=UPI00080CD45A|nr:uncharacterized protein I203_02718 [Kwoniella mangroviensis CBS 8507]OCF68059.1 hypothetical protein I203_02718 [Kwoniella mangroviensis CBS 8507]